jgi:hypothetical protein
LLRFEIDRFCRDGYRQPSNGFTIASDNQAVKIVAAPLYEEVSNLVRVGDTIAMNGMMSTNGIVAIAVAIVHLALD